MTRKSRAVYYREWRRNNPDKTRQYRRRYDEAHPELVKHWQREWRKNNRDHVRQRSRNYRRKNPQQFKAYRIKYAPKRALRGKLYRKAHPEMLRAATARWRKANMEHRRAYARMNYRRRIKTDMNYLIRSRIRCRLLQAIRRNSTRKSCSSLQLLGCSIPNFRLYIESKFEIGMNWQNYGCGREKWNFDHILPCAIFDLTKPEHQKRCFHFSNYQPMWQPENIRKRDSVPFNHVPLT